MSDKGSVLSALRSLHRPLVVLTGAMALLTVVSLAGLVFDDRTLTGDPIWLKPFKFALAIGMYGITLAWLLSLVRRGRRVGWVLGTLFSAAMLMDVGLLVWQMIFRDTTLHFNKATPTDVTINNIVASGAFLAWGVTGATVVLLLFQRLPDRALASALRWGTAISGAGMAVGFLMFSPTPSQQAAFEAGGKPSTFGAHTVGGDDGGPGLPITHWSTLHGDLRIPHFVGIHAMQALPLVALGLVLLARRFPLLRSDLVRRRLVRSAALGYGGLVGLLTWQAERGQSVVRPDFWTLAAGTGLVVVVAVAVAASLRTRERFEALPPLFPHPSRG